MQLKTSNPFWQVLGLGVLAGMRSTAAPAIVSHILSHHHSPKLAHSPLSFMQSQNVATALKVMAVGELVADKLPLTPNRTKPIAIVARCLSGALSGAVIYKAANSNVAAGALLCGSAAFAATFGSFFLRKSVVNKSRLMDPLIGAIEDALVIGAGVGLAECY
jgi:uncharacterized membrane protein